MGGRDLRVDLEGRDADAADGLFETAAPREDAQEVPQARPSSSAANPGAERTFGSLSAAVAANSFIGAGMRFSALRTLLDFW